MVLVALFTEQINDDADDDDDDDELVRGTSFYGVSKAYRSLDA